MGLYIDELGVGQAMADIAKDIAESTVISNYERLINNFTESSGKESEALKELLNTEKKLVIEMDATILRLLMGVYNAADILINVDKNGANAIKIGVLNSELSANT